MLRRFLFGHPDCRASHRRFHGLCHQEVRPNERRRRERQGGSLGPLHRRNAGADAEERGTDFRGRSEGPGGGAVGAAGQRGRRRQTPRTHGGSAVNAGKVDTMDKASKRLVYEVVLSEVAATSSSARRRCRTKRSRSSTRWSQQLKPDPKDVYIEIEGHTDNVGPKATNDKIGLDRAEAVQRYLYEQYQIPLHKMSVISYGRRQAGCAEQDEGGPRAESSRRDQGARVRDCPAKKLEGTSPRTIGWLLSNFSSSSSKPTAHRPSALPARPARSDTLSAMAIRTELNLRLPNSPGALAGRLPAAVRRARQHSGDDARRPVDSCVWSSTTMSTARRCFANIITRSTSATCASCGPERPGRVRARPPARGDADVNVEYAYGGGAEGSASASVVVGVDDAERAAAAAGV